MWKNRRTDDGEIIAAWLSLVSLLLFMFFLGRISRLVFGHLIGG
jgi:hypothetical protein